MRKALEHLRVLDMSRVLAGPFLAQNLADFGADVIKVERPHHGDESRTFPPYLKDTTGTETEDSAYFMSTNRGKRSVTIDISRSRGQELIKELAARSDVLIENYKVGDLKRYGLDYEASGTRGQRISRQQGKRQRRTKPAVRLTTIPLQELHYSRVCSRS